MKIKLEDNGMAYSGLLNLKKITQSFGRKNTLSHKGRATKESHLFQITAWQPPVNPRFKARNNQQKWSWN